MVSESCFLEQRRSDPIVGKWLIWWWPGTELNRRRQPFQGCILWA